MPPRHPRHELDAQLVRKLAALLLCNCPLARPVRLVVDEDLVGVFRGMLLVFECHVRISA